MSYKSESNRAHNFKSAYTSRSSDFEITRKITPWIKLYLIQLLSGIIICFNHFFFFLLDTVVFNNSIKANKIQNFFFGDTFNNQ